MDIGRIINVVDLLKELQSSNSITLALLHVCNHINSCPNSVAKIITGKGQYLQCYCEQTMWINYWVPCWCSSIGDRCSLPTYPRDLLAPNYEFLCKIQRLQQNIKPCPKENVLDQKIYIRMVHDLLHKSDKIDNMLATLTAYEFSQLTVLQSERQIKFMSV